MGKKGMSVSHLSRAQIKEKNEHRQKILDFLKDKGRASNNDIERLLMISDATATRYMQELEQDKLIRQVGITGRFVYYELA
jgi:predicted transcriptional regulator